MRPRFVAGAVGLGALLLSGCAHTLPNLGRPKVPEGGNYVTGPHYVPHGRAKAHITGPDRLRLFDGDPLKGAVAFVTPDIVRFADGLTVPREQVGWIELAHPVQAPGLPSNSLHDAVELRDGSIIEGALVAMDEEGILLAVYGPSPNMGTLTSVLRADVVSIALQDRRGTPCGRAAVVLPYTLKPGVTVAEVSNLDLDTVNVMWLDDPAKPATKVLRCFPRAGGASGCQVLVWANPDNACDVAIEGLTLHATADAVAHMSEAREVYYAVRSGENTLGKSETLTRGRQHKHVTRPQRLVGNLRGESHYWDRSWRQRQNDGMHAIK